MPDALPAGSTRSADARPVVATCHRRIAQTISAPRMHEPKPALHRNEPGHRCRGFRTNDLTPLHVRTHAPQLRRFTTPPICTNDFMPRAHSNPRPAFCETNPTTALRESHERFRPCTREPGARLVRLSPALILGGAGFDRGCRIQRCSAPAVTTRTRAPWRPH